MSRMRAITICGLLACAIVGAAGAWAEETKAEGAGGAAGNMEMKVAESPDKATPLKVGDKAPMGMVKTMDGKELALKDLYAKGPTVLVFYRGGWCPYCTKHLAALGSIQGELMKEGVQLAAIAPELPEMSQKTAEEKKLETQLLSDPSAETIKAFGLAFKLDDKTIEKYHGYGIDLEKRSGMSHHILPVPAAYVIDKEGTIRFAHWDANITKRLDPQKLLAAAKEAKAATAEPMTNAMKTEAMKQ